MKRLPAKKFKQDRDEPYALVCEEAHLYLGADIGDTLATGRHNGLVIWICVQHLQKLVSGSVDLIADVLGLCGSVYTCKQANEQDLDILAPLHARQNLDFTQHTQVQQLHNGYKHFMTEQHAYTDGFSITESESDGTTNNETNNVSRGNTKGKAKTWSLTNLIGLSRGESESEAANKSESSGTNDNQFGSESQSTGISNNRGTSSTQQRSRSKNDGGSESESWVVTIGKAIGRAITKTITRGFTKNSSHTVTHTHNYQAQYREIVVETGKLKRSISDQIAEVKQIIGGLDTGQCVVSIWNEPSFVVQTPFVPDEGHPEFKEFMLEQLKNEIYQRHEYHFIPEMQRVGIRPKKKRGMK
jgi:hypothetical protein